MQKNVCSDEIPSLYDLNCWYDVKQQSLWISNQEVTQSDLFNNGSYVPININPKRGGGGSGRSQGELDNFEKLLTNSPPIGKTLCLKSAGWAIKFVI